MYEYFQAVYQHAVELAKIPGFKESNSLLEHYQKCLSEKPGVRRDGDANAYSEAADVIAAQMVPEEGREREELAALLKKIYQLGVLAHSQAPLTGMLLEDLSRSAENQLTQMGYQLRRPLCGLANTGRLNGRAVSYGGEQPPVVLIEDGIFIFSHLLAKAAADSLFLNERSRNPENYGSEPASVEEFSKIFEAVRQDTRRHIGNANRFGELIYAYVVVGDPTAAPQYAGFPESQPLAAQLTRSIEQFIVSHEFSHCALKHLDGPSRRVRSKESAGETDARWNNELAADLLAFAVTQKSMVATGMHPYVPIAAIAMYFDALEIVERGVTIFLGPAAGEKTRDYHPPHATRRERLFEFFLQLYPQAPDQAGEFTIKLHEVVASQWELIEARLLIQKQQSDRISSKWISDLDSVPDATPLHPS